MFSNLLTLVIIPQKTSRVIRLRVPQGLLKFLLILIVFLVGGSGYIVYDYLKIRKVILVHKELQEEIISQKIEMKWVNNELLSYWSNLDFYAEFDRKLRVIIGVKDDFVMRGGAIGRNSFSSDEESEEAAERKHTLALLEKIESRVRQRELSFFQLETYLQDRKDKLERTPSISPVRGFVRSRFGMRYHPITGKRTRHTGIDISGREFTPVYAPAAGVVTGTFQNGGYGNFLVIDHGYGITTRYAHLAKFEVKVGEKIKRGDLIARVGNTGASTGPHLHYEVLVGEKKINPELYILDSIEM